MSIRRHFFFLILLFGTASQCHSEVPRLTAAPVASSSTRKTNLWIDLPAVAGFFAFNVVVTAEAPQVIGGFFAVAGPALGLEGTTWPTERNLDFVWIEAFSAYSAFGIDPHAEVGVRMKRSLVAWSALIAAGGFTSYFFHEHKPDKQAFFLVPCNGGGELVFTRAFGKNR